MIITNSNIDTTIANNPSWFLQANKPMHLVADCFDCGESILFDGRERVYTYQKIREKTIVI